MQLRRRDFLVAASASVGAPLRAAQPENRVVLNLEPSRDNPRNSEGAKAAVIGRPGRAGRCGVGPSKPPSPVSRTDARALRLPDDRTHS